MSWFESAGATVDLAPLVRAAQGIWRNALRDAEHEVETGVSRQTVSLVTFGMRIAVLNLFGAEAVQRFEDAVEGKPKR